jgi:hypothetical protein
MEEFEHKIKKRLSFTGGESVSIFFFFFSFNSLSVCVYMCVEKKKKIQFEVERYRPRRRRGLFSHLVKRCRSPRLGWMKGGSAYNSARPLPPRQPESSKVWSLSSGFFFKELYYCCSCSILLSVFKRNQRGKK